MTESVTKVIARIRPAGKWVEFWWRGEPDPEPPSFHYCAKWYQLMEFVDADEALTLHVLNHGYAGLRVTLRRDEHNNDRIVGVAGGTVVVESLPITDRLREGTVSKGGVNRTFQFDERPPPPAAVHPVRKVRRPVIATRYINEPVLIVSFQALTEHEELRVLATDDIVRRAFMDGWGFCEAGSGVWFVPMANVEM